MPEVVVVVAAAAAASLLCPGVPGAAGGRKRTVGYRAPLRAHQRRCAPVHVRRWPSDAFRRRTTTWPQPMLCSSGPVRSHPHSLSLCSTPLSMAFMSTTNTNNINNSQQSPCPSLLRSAAPGCSLPQTSSRWAWAAPACWRRWAAPWRPWRAPTCAPLCSTSTSRTRAAWHWRCR